MRSCRKPLPLFKPSLPPSDIEEALYNDLHSLTLVGLVGIRDPPREDVPSTIEVIRRAGVRVFMVTGDFKLTAVAIARQVCSLYLPHDTYVIVIQVGIVTQDRIDTIDNVRSSALSDPYRAIPPLSPSAIKPSPDGPERALVLTGEDISSLTQTDWDTIIGSYTELVFARTTPDQKLKIVEMIKARGDNTVAVTGDGVNDAPALKAADIGVAMGAGSDVAKEAAALILLTNEFASIPVAIEMGRLVFDNLKKVTLYLMPVSVPPLPSHYECIHARWAGTDRVVYGVYGCAFECDAWDADPIVVVSPSVLFNCERCRHVYFAHV